jgi:hypothetical protein
MSDLRAALIANLAAFGSQPLPAAARAFFKTLGYQSDRTIPVGSVDAFCRQFDSEGRLAQTKNSPPTPVCFRTTRSSLASFSLTYSSPSSLLAKTTLAASSPPLPAR